MLKGVFKIHIFSENEYYKQFHIIFLENASHCIYLIVLKYLLLSIECNKIYFLFKSSFILQIPIVKYLHISQGGNKEHRPILLF